MNIEAELAAIKARLDALEEKVPEGCLVKGKYKGQKSADIAVRYPDYVIWCADEGFAKGLGFTDADIAIARRSRQVVNKSHYSAGDIDDDIPF